MSTTCMEMRPLAFELSMICCVSGAVELQKELALTTNLELPSTLVFDYPTIAEMNTFILASMPAEEAKSPSVLMPLEAAVTPKIATAQSALILMDNAGRKQIVENQVPS